MDPHRTELLFLDILKFIELPTSATKAMTLFAIYASGIDWGPRESFATVPPQVMAEFTDFAQQPKDVLLGLLRQGLSAIRGHLR